MKSIEDRFWSKVDKSGDCWEWTAAKNSHGYGLMGHGGKVVGAHRVAWILANGNPGKLCVLHRCDNPGCVNPGHLFLGTVADNMRDMTIKGRRVCGERHGLAKLTENRVEEIRMWVRAGFSQSKIGAAYGVAQNTVSQLVNRKRWKHVS